MIHEKNDEFQVRSKRQKNKISFFPMMMTVRAGGNVTTFLSWEPMEFNLPNPSAHISTTYLVGLPRLFTPVV